MPIYRGKYKLFTQGKLLLEITFRNKAVLEGLQDVHMSAIKKTNN
jgi:hypothetical protein